MPRFVLALAAATLAAFVALPTSASAALKITKVQLTKGSIAVAGAGAVASSSITWEGQQVASATKSGGFKFTTTIIPANRPTSCLAIGTLGDSGGTIDVVVPLCLTGPAGPPGPTGGPGVVVRDSNNALVGTVVGFGKEGHSSCNVARNIGGEVIVLPTSKDGFFASNAFNVLYTSNDCSSAPLFDLTDADTLNPLVPFPLYPGSLIGTTYYYWLGGGASQMAINSQRRAFPEFAGDVCSGTVLPDGSCCSSLSGQTTTVSTNVAIIDLSTLGLVPPFHLEAPGPSIGVNPTPGTFVGFTSEGGALTIKVGSIEAIAFTCNGTQINHAFSPPESVNGDGTFDVLFSEAGHNFHLSGQFADNNDVAGVIDDDQNQCDSSFEAARQSGAPKATPTPGP